MNIDVCWRKWSQWRYVSPRVGKLKQRPLIYQHDITYRVRDLGFTFWEFCLSVLMLFSSGFLMNISTELWTFSVCVWCVQDNFPETNWGSTPENRPSVAPFQESWVIFEKNNMVPFPFNCLVGFSNLNLFGELSRITFQGLVHSLLDFREGMFFLYLKPWHPKWVKHNHLH